MDVFAQNKLLFRLIFLLVFLNVSVLGFLFWKTTQGPPPFGPLPHHRGPHREVTGILKKELNMSDEQAEKINQVRIDFFEKENDVLELLHQQRDSLNEEMFAKQSDENLLNQLAKRISENEFRMEHLRMAQAKEFKKLCTPEQLDKFQNLVMEIREYFRPNHPPMLRK